MKKYELMDETTVVDGTTLRRIKALKDFYGVKKGEIGGYIEKEENLSQDGTAWVFNDAMVSGNAWVSGNAQVDGKARVYGSALVSGNTNLYGDADVFKKTHYLNIGAIGSRFGFTTFFRNVGPGIMVSCGCFLGTIEEFKEKVKETHGDNKHAQAYLKACELAELQIELKGDIENE